MENYKKVHQWAAGITVEEGLKELQGLKLKYPWLRCDKSLEALERLSKDLPAIVKILLLQEKQNAIHRMYIAVNGLADTAITEAIIQKFKIDLDA
jgi:hypothetical protein